MIDPKYPIGKYEPQPFSEELKKNWIADIEFLPSEIENSILNLDEKQLATPYRDGGWTLHQVVHHVADSHMNAFIRLKLGLTEDNPIIKPYNEAAWAELEDVKSLPINRKLSRDKFKVTGSLYFISLGLSVNRFLQFKMPSLS